MNWQYQSEAASRAVRYLRGVRNVTNAVTIKPTVSPAGIKAAITAAFARAAQLEGRDTTVTAYAKGVVTVEGAVQCSSERRQAETVAWSAPGVAGVNNNLGIAAA